MEVITYLLSYAKLVGVSGVLLVGICNHESGGFKQNFAPFDVGSPSFGSCQLKAATAFQLGFKGTPFALNDPKLNARYAALYLRYQMDRYGDDWVKITSAYNAGSFVESRRVPGCPRNLKYVHLVRDKLPVDFQNRLDCGNDSYADNEE